MSIFIGKRFCFVDEAEYEGRGAEHIFAMAVERIHLFAENHAVMALIKCRETSERRVKWAY